MNYGISKTTQLRYEDAIEKVTVELKKEGFGIITSIDMKETLKNKLGVDYKKYTILGACNPTFAYQALQEEENIGLLLPCNVIVYEEDESAVINAFDPMAMTMIIDNPAIEPFAREIRLRLERVIASM